MHTLLEPESVVRRRAQGPHVGRQCAPVGSDRWEQRFADLLAFKTAHGHCSVPSSYQEDPSLAVWVFNCRRQRKLGSLDTDRCARLDAIGFVWAVRTRRFVARDWDAMVAQLESFYRDHGHGNVPHAWPRNRELAAWLHGVRCNKRSGRIDADRVRQLDALGVVWDPQQTRWENRFAALVEYRQHHGDCNVPCDWPENPTLAMWVKGVRASQKRGDLDFERIRRLEAIGFGCDRSDEWRWEKMYAELADYQHVHGHCRISTLSEDYRSLGNWVHTQRTLRKQGRLDQERIAQLDGIGFTWDIRVERWDAMFAALQDYHRATGHCEVPQTWADNRKLGNWVMMQRAAYKAGRLNGEQLERLQAIDFRFSIVGDPVLVARSKKSRQAPQPERRRAA